MKYVFLFVLVGIVACIEQEEVPRECSQGGRMCETCTTTIVCVDLGNGIFEKKNRATCASGESCLDSTGLCSPDANPRCDPTLPFVCNAPGLYPHPDDWARYVMCVPKIDNDSQITQPVEVECPTGFYYNATSMYCDILEQCIDPLEEPPVPVCKNISTIAPHPKNPSIFYSCGEYGPNNRKLYAFMDMCPSGGYYDPIRYSCILPSGCCVAPTEAPAPPVTDAPAPPVTEAPVPPPTEAPVPPPTEAPVPPPTEAPVPPPTEAPVPPPTEAPVPPPVTDPPAPPSPHEKSVLKMPKIKSVGYP